MAGEETEARAITEGKTPVVNRQIKDSVFTDLFSSKANLLACTVRYTLRMWRQVRTTLPT